MAKHGVLLPTRGVVSGSGGPTELTARVRSDVVALAALVEALRFDSVWVGDSVLAKPRLEPVTTLAAIAARTKAIGLGTAVYLPALRHPVHVANQTTTLDLLSGGRLSLGVGVGIRPAEREEQDQLGVTYEQRGAVVDESLAVIDQLWNGETVDYDGDYVSLEGVNLEFTPIRSPPIYVASAAFDPAEQFPQRIRDRIAARADGWLPIATPPESYAAGLKRISEAVTTSGRAPESVDPAYYQDVVIAETEEVALDRARSFLRTYYGDDSPAYRPDATFDDERIRQRGAFGPPSVVRSHLDRYEDAGVETFVTRFATGDQREQLRAYADILG